MTSTQDPSIDDLMAQLYAYTRYVEEQVHELAKKMEEGFQADQAQSHKHIRYLEEQVPELNKHITNIQGQEVDFDAIPLCSAEGCGAQAAFACAGGDHVCDAHAAPCARCGLMASAADFSEAKVRLGKLELAVESLTSVQFHYEMNECLKGNLEKLNAHVMSINKNNPTLSAARAPHPRGDLGA